jgi:uncharacterized protein with beta-barrel porin domain
VGDDGILTLLIERATSAAMITRDGPNGAGEARRAGAWRSVVVAAAIIIATTTTGWAQCITNFCNPPPSSPPPQVPGTSSAIGAASNYALFGLGTQYLQLLGGMGGPSWQSSLFGTGPNPGGGGAPAPPAGPTWRAWGEAYGQTSHTGAQDQANFPGDSRHTYGGVAGLAMNVTPSATLGISVDQSKTTIDIVGLPQHASLDLTQIGINGAYELGAWTVSAAGVGGFARVDSNRDTLSGPATAAYDANLWGAIAEASYYVPLGSARIVPKFGADWTQSHTDAYAEMGGIDAVSVPAATADRTRIFAGAEIGNTWVTSTTVVDLSGYARAVDILSQHVPNLTVNAVSGPATPVTVFGLTEAKYGLDTGASVSVRLSPIARLYAVYDGRFRNGFDSHTGTLGLELRW